MLKNKTSPGLGVGVPPVSGFRSNHLSISPFNTEVKITSELATHSRIYTYMPLFKEHFFLVETTVMPINPTHKHPCREFRKSTWFFFKLYVILCRLLKIHRNDISLYSNRLWMIANNVPNTQIFLDKPTKIWYNRI